MSTALCECKYCHVTDSSLFYASNTRCCKVCKKPENRNKKIGAKDRDPNKKGTYLCIICNKDLPKDNFDVSETTHLVLDKCKKCKYGTRRMFVTPITDEYKDPRYIELETWVKNTFVGISKTDAVILSKIFARI